MNPISRTVTPFLTALRSGESIAITHDGNWYRKGIVQRIIDAVRGIFGYDEAYDNAKNLAISLSSLPKVTVEGFCGISQPSTWSSDDLARVVEAVKATIQQKADGEQQQIQAIKVQRDALRAGRKDSSPFTQLVTLNKKIYNPEGWSYRTAAANLDRAVLMHRYLGIDQRAIHSSPVKKEDAEWLTNELRDWQRHQFPSVDYLSEEPDDFFHEALLEQCPTVDDFLQRLHDQPSLLPRCISHQEAPGGAGQPVDLTSLFVRRQLRRLYHAWRRHHAVKEKIMACCRYGEFIAAARRNRALLDMCFQTVFKSMPDHFVNAIDIFIQAPQIQEQLRKSYLDKRIRDIANRGIGFVQYGLSDQGLPIKGVHLLIDGDYQSITDETAQVHVARGVYKTVAQMFEEFEAQNFRFIELEYLQDTGVTAFDGRLLRFDVNKPEWWKDLPVLRRMTREQIEDTYDTDFQEGHAFFAVRASRTSPDLNGDGNHGWADLLIPLPDGTFNCLSLGKFSNWFPTTTWETFHHVFRTHQANVTVLDTNSFMSSRDRISIPFPPISQDHFPAIMNSLKEELLRSRRGELIFQAQGDNCASWVRHFIQRNWPGLNIEPYQTPFQDLILPTIFMPLIWTRDLFPNDAAWHWFRRTFCSMFGALSYHDLPGGGQVRLLDNHDWGRGILQIPSRLWIERERVLARIRDYMEARAGAPVAQQPSAEAVAV